MPNTSCLVKFGFYAMAIKDNAVPTMPNLQPFSKIDDLQTENIQADLYATYEGDYWLLDGNFKFIPADVTKIHIGIMNDSVSGADGIFLDPPTLTIDFPVDYSINGLTLRFAPSSDDYASDINVQFYNSSGGLIRNDNYMPNEYEFTTSQDVFDFRKIVIVFNATNNPYRYLRFTSIDYGDLITFSGNDIKTALVVEQIDPLSMELPINTMELNLFSNSTAFDITDPTGDYFDLQNRQPLDVYENVGANRLYIGRYYLDAWENKSDTQINFKTVDIIGVLDTIIYFGGMFTAITAADLLEQIFTAQNIPYNLDADLSAETLTGWIPVCTHREALQQIAFAIGAYVSTARNNVLQIKKTPTEYTVFDATITAAEKGLQQTLTLKPLVTGVELLSHDYAENTDVIELYNGVLTVGNHTITFSEPAHDLSISGGTVASSGANYAVVNVTVEGTLILSGEKYTDAQQIHGIYYPSLDPNIKTNILSIASATLVNSANAATIAQRVYNYYQMRYWQKVKLFTPSAEAGDVVLIDTLKSKQIAGMVERMTLDLTGGFTAQTEIIGVIQP